MLFCPANRQELIEKAVARGADAVVVDLEDSVPEADKEKARANLQHLPASPVPVYVRINGPPTPWALEDLRAAVQAGVSGVVVPKAESPDDIRRLDEEASRQEAARRSGRVEFILMVESSLGVLRAYELAHSTHRVVSLCCAAGEAGDLVADLGCSWSPEGIELLYARSHVLLAARAAGLEYPLDGVYMNFRDSEGLRRECMLAKRLGYTGKMVIHPAQIPVVHEVFTPTEEEVAQQRRVVEAYERALQEGRGAIELDGRMIDYAVVRKAKRVLALAARMQRNLGTAR